jgi:hypothetical protein
MTRIAVTLGIVALALVSPYARISAQPAPATADAGPTTLGLGTILGDFSYFAGQLVRVPKARVRDVLSPRLFTVEVATMPHSYIDHNGNDGGRALVIADKPGVELKRGLVVEIIGRPWTFAGATRSVGGNWSADLDEGERKQFGSRAVIGADIVRLPGRIEVGADR